MCILWCEMRFVAWKKLCWIDLLQLFTLVYLIKVKPMSITTGTLTASTTDVKAADVDPGQPIKSPPEELWNQKVSVMFSNTIIW